MAEGSVSQPGYLGLSYTVTKIVCKVPLKLERKLCSFGWHASPMEISQRMPIFSRHL